MINIIISCGYIFVKIHSLNVSEQKDWWSRPDLNWYSFWPGDFKSPVSTDSTTGPKAMLYSNSYGIVKRQLKNIGRGGSN